MGKFCFWEINFSFKMTKKFWSSVIFIKKITSNDFSNRLGSIGCYFYFFNCHGCLGKKWGRIHWHMISFSTYEVYLSKFLILTSFILLIFITLAVIYISYVSWKDKRRLKKYSYSVIKPSHFYAWLQYLLLKCLMFFKDLKYQLILVKQ